MMHMVTFKPCFFFWQELWNYLCKKLAGMRSTSSLLPFLKEKIGAGTTIVHCQKLINKQKVTMLNTIL